MMKKILFVCLGNICRSPMAEYILRDMAQKRGIAVNVASAGTSGWHDGEYMHCGTAEIWTACRLNRAISAAAKYRPTHCSITITSS